MSTIMPCRWMVKPKDKDMEEPCGREKRLYTVKGNTFTAVVCEEHVPAAWKRWDCETAELVTLKR